MLLALEKFLCIFFVVVVEVDIYFKLKNKAYFFFFSKSLLLISPSAKCDGDRVTVFLTLSSLFQSGLQVGGIGPFYIGDNMSRKFMTV